MRTLSENVTNIYLKKYRWMIFKIFLIIYENMLTKNELHGYEVCI